MLRCVVWLWLFLGFLPLLESPCFGQRELKDIPDPDPELERSTFIVADGFEVNLYAADPQMAKPIQMNFDAQGRLWVASSEVYPHIKPGQKATDKILVIDDRDHDGVADQTTVFANGLFIPTGVIPGDGGAYVANSTELIHLGDTNGDGIADRKTIVLSGFGTEDTHHLLHTLRWGMDGLLYMNQSIYIHSHVETPTGVVRLNGGGIWRFRPETRKLDVLCYGFVNSWGHHQDAWGQSFATDGAFGEGINYVFPGSVFFSAPNSTRIVSGLNPGSPKHCGLEIVSGRGVPDDWQGNMITNDFRAHRVCRFVIGEEGSAYSSRQENEVIKTNHVAFRPIDVKMGPDGAIYIADWYNPIIQHGEVDFRDERRDHVHGRIWRVSAKGRPKIDTRIPANASIEDLIGRLEAPEEWTRTFAKQMLKNHEQKAPGAVAPKIRAWLAKLDSKSSNFDRQRLEALWAFQAIDRPEVSLLKDLLASKDHRVRAAAIRVVTQWEDSLPDADRLLQVAARDSHARVRLETVRALSRHPSLESATAAASVLDAPMDRFLDFAVWQTMRDLAPVWLPAARDGKFDFGSVDRLTFALRAIDSPDVAGILLPLVEHGAVPNEKLSGTLTLIAASANPDQLAAILRTLDSNRSLDASGVAVVLRSVEEAGRRLKAAPTGDLSSLAKFSQSANDEVAAAAFKAIGAFRYAPLRGDVETVAKASKNHRPGVRAAAISSLGQFGDENALSTLTAIVSKDSDPIAQSTALATIASVDLARGAKMAVGLLGSPSGGLDSSFAAVRSILTQNGGNRELTEALKGASISPDVARLLLRVARSAPQPSEELIQAIRGAGRLSDAGWKKSPELVAELVRESRENGDPARGQLVYRRKELQCLKCHAIAGIGGAVGPSMESLGASAQPDYLVDSLLDPNAKVKEGFHSQQILTDEGKLFTGVVIRESENELTLRNAEDEMVTIAKNDIDERKESRSLMPDGTVDSLTKQELVDLVRFLSDLGKIGKFAIGKEPFVRRWRSLVWTQEAHTLLNRTSNDSAATGGAELTWEPAYSEVSGQLPLEDLPRFNVHFNTPPTSFVRFEFEATGSGKVALDFGTSDGLEMWLDGKPTPLANRVELDAKQGRHVVTLAIDRNVRTTPLTVLLVSENAQIVGGK